MVARRSPRWSGVTSAWPGGACHPAYSWSPPRQRPRGRHDGDDHRLTRSVVGGLAGGEALQQVALDRVEADPLLLHRVARPDRDCLVLKSLEVHRDAEGRTDLVLTPIAPADRPGVVELHVPPLPQHRGQVTRL